MIVSAPDAVTRLAELYQAETDVPFDAVLLGDSDLVNDETLADLIAADGAERRRRGLATALERYLKAVPSLRSSPLSLDAAIEAALCARARSSRPTNEAVDWLEEEYPDLGQSIREAAALTRALCSTMELGSIDPRARLVPCDFGPPLEDGRARYRLINRLSSGSSAVVYEAEDRLLSDRDRPAVVAIKVLGRCDSTLAAVLAQEAAKARRIDHPNVVRALDRGQTREGEPYIVYEMVEGGDLHTWANGRTPVAPNVAARLVAEIAAGVHAAHQAGLIHCDLKPQNVLLSPSGTPKVADFGIARRGEDEPGERLHSYVRGNLAFMSPEQFAGRDASVSILSDVYAIGGILFYLLTGRVPNGATADDAVVWLSSEESEGEGPSPRAMAPKVPRELDRVCRRALSRNPRVRHGSAAEMSLDLRRFLERKPIEWTKPSVVGRTALWVQRRPWAATMITVVTILGALLAVAGVRAIQLEDTARRMNRFQTTFSSFDRYHASLGRDVFETEHLAFIWTLEWLGAYADLIDPAMWRERMREQRTQAVQKLIDDARRCGRGEDLETMLWELSVAFWRLTDKQPHAEAEAELGSLRLRLVEHVRPGDAILHQVDAMLAAATVKRHSIPAFNSGKRAPEAALRQVEVAERVLLAKLEVLGGDRPGSPVHLIILKALEFAYRPHLLDRPQERERIVALQQSFERKRAAPGASGGGPAAR